MENSAILEIAEKLRSLSEKDQDYLAGMLLMERLKRNKLVMPTLHKRIDDAEAENWSTWQDNPKGK